VVVVSVSVVVVVVPRAGRNDFIQRKARPGSEGMATTQDQSFARPKPAQEIVAMM